MSDDDELQFHIDMHTRDLIADGMTAEAARDEAMRRFGDVEDVRAQLAGIRRRRIFTAFTLLVLAAASVMHRLLWYLPAYVKLHGVHPFYVAESIKNLCEIGVCCVALVVMRERIMRALGLDRRIVRAFAFALAASSPMLLGFAIARQTDVKDWLAVAYLAFFSPFAEEVVTRGFAFRTLRRLGWPMWPAAALCALVTGLCHIEKGQTASAILGLFFFTALGGFTFCWIVERWNSLWFAFALHALMNFWWEVFNVAPTAIGGWYAFVLQNATMILAILITLRFTSSRSRLQTVGEDRLRDRGELHVRRAFVDLADLRIAPELLNRILFRVPVAAEDLH
jgi:membrane protease YdiL (CAAX protease family)